MPDVTEITFKEATKKLKELGLEVNIEGLNENNNINEETIVIDQLPKKGIKISKGSKVTLYVK